MKIKNTWNNLSNKFNHKNYATIELPSKEELYENPIEKICIEDPKWYSLQGDVLEIMRQFLTGYLWEVKFGNRFYAVHSEQYEAKRILHFIEFAQNKEKNKEWWPTMDEEMALIMVDFARLVPRMWD